jgi:ubiquinone biosynthesis protein
MEFIKGVKVNKPGALDGPNIDRNALTETFMRAFIKQIFIDGFFHGDPHPGNIFVNPETGVLTYLDLGLMGRLDQTKRLDLIDLLISFSQNDSTSLANLALRLSKKTRPVDVNAFRDDMTELLNQYVRYSANPSFDKMISEFFGLLQRYGLRLDKQFTLAIKSVVQSQAVVTALGGQVDFVPFAVQEIKTMTLAELTQDKIIGTVQQQVTAVGKELLRRVPNLQDATMSWLDQYMSGKLVVHVDTSDLSRHVDALGGHVTRLTAGLIITGMIIGTAIVSSQMWQLQNAGQEFLPFVAVTIFVITLFVGLVMVWRMMTTKRVLKD